MVGWLYIGRVASRRCQEMIVKMLAGARDDNDKQNDVTYRQ